MAAEWHYRSGTAEFGPLSTPELIRLAADGQVTPETPVRKGDGAWATASKVAGLFDRAAEVREAAARSLPPERAATFAPASSPSSPSAPSSARYEVLDEAESEGFKVEVLAYSRLGGAKDHRTASTVYFANQAGIRLKQVRITLRDGEAIAESGALHFMLGRIEMESKIGGVAGLGKAMMNKFVTKEAAIMPPVSRDGPDLPGAVFQPFPRLPPGRRGGDRRQGDVLLRAGIARRRLGHAEERLVGPLRRRGLVPDAGSGGLGSSSWSRPSPPTRC